MILDNAKIETKDGHIIYNIDDGGIIEVRQIFVKEEKRHQGVGEELLSKLPKGVMVVYSSTDPEREVFGKFLIACGFVKTNEYNSTGDKWIKEPVVEPVKKVKKVVKKVAKKKK